MTMQALFGYLRILLLFVVFWAGFWAWNNIGCRRIEGVEMEPALKKDSAPWISPGLRTVDKLKHDDLVSYTVLSGGRVRNTAARVVGLPGDRVKIVKGDVFLNGTKIDSNYVTKEQKSDETYEEIIVPRDHIFALCDGRKSALMQKLDSRTVGPLGHWAIAGKY